MRIIVVVVAAVMLVVVVLVVVVVVVVLVVVVVVVVVVLQVLQRVVGSIALMVPSVMEFGSSSLLYWTSSCFPHVSFLS